MFMTISENMKLDAIYMCVELFPPYHHYITNMRAIIIHSAPSWNTLLYDSWQQQTKTRNNPKIISQYLPSSVQLWRIVNCSWYAHFSIVKNEPTHPLQNITFLMTFHGHLPGQSAILDVVALRRDVSDFFYFILKQKFLSKLKGF
jgi:hypothetical protein